MKIDFKELCGVDKLSQDGSVNKRQQSISVSSVPYRDNYSMTPPVRCKSSPADTRL